jgi:hypothetical protein
MKIREGLAVGDYTDPGPYKNPQGTVAYEIENPAAPAQRKGERKADVKKPANEIKAVKPGRGGAHKDQH